jgi:hypothetical protein
MKETLRGAGLLRILIRATFVALFGGAAVAQTNEDFGALDPLIAAVDARMGAGTMQLVVPRARDDDFDIPPEDGQASTFGHQIASEVARHLEADQVRFTDYFDDTFKVEPGDDPSAVSLVSHPLCEESRATLGTTLRRSNGLTDAEIGYVNAFADHANTAREAFLANPADRLPALRTWTALGTCLAYAESLGDPDTSTSRNRAQQLLGEHFEKPNGVKFYYDSGHENEASRWNIGLFQFVLFRGGNIQPCLVSWQAQGLPGGNVRSDLDIEEMGHFVGSPGQSFNAFCGMNKIVQTLAINALTTDASRTHPSNRVNGGLKPSPQRCVSLHNRRAYAHFGPLIRTSTSTAGYTSNLEKVMSCAVAVLEE